MSFVRGDAVFEKRTKVQNEQNSQAYVRPASGWITLLERTRENPIQERKK